MLLSEEKEARLQTLVPSSSSEKHANLNLHRTLEEINREIVELVVKEEGGNQSAAARRLGISRTTLWRILKL
ncbi:MAG: helix-turn-helix domain-containing protein [Eisenbergiella sp.]